MSYGTVTFVNCLNNDVNITLTKYSDLFFLKTRTIKFYLHSFLTRLRFSNRVNELRNIKILHKLIGGFHNVSICYADSLCYYWTHNVRYSKKTEDFVFNFC